MKIRSFAAPVGLSLLALTLMGGANGADAVLTQRAIAAGGYERNAPWLYGQRAERIVPLKLVVTAAEAGVLVVLRRRDKRAAWAWVAGVVAVNLYFAQRNSTLTGRLRSGPPRG